MLLSVTPADGSVQRASVQLRCRYPGVGMCRSTPWSAISTRSAWRTTSTSLRRKIAAEWFIFRLSGTAKTIEKSKA